MDIGLGITLAALAILIVVILAIMVYHQMLLLNELNKRLLLLAKDSIDNERNTMAELQEALTLLERTTQEQSSPSRKSKEGFAYDQDLDI